MYEVDSKDAVIDKSHVYLDELKEAIYAAIQVHGRMAGIDKDGVTSLHRWSLLVRGDGHKIQDINRWLKPGVQPYASSLMDLADVFRSYHVRIGKKVMPRDYFLSILAFGKYKALAAPMANDETKSQAWIKRQLRDLTYGDRLAVLGWFMGLVGVSVQGGEDVKSQNS